MFETAGYLRALSEALFSSCRREIARVGTSRRWRSPGYLGAAIVALHAVLICPAARADVIDCLQVVTTGLSEAAKGLQLGECADKAADPTPKFAAMLFVVGAGMANGWLPDDGHGCKSAIWGVAGTLLLEMLKIVPIPALEPWKAELAAMGQAQLKQLMYSNPALKEIADLFNCACDVVAFGKAALNNVLNEAKGCGQVVADAVNFFGNGITALGEGFGVPCPFGLCGSANPTTPMCAFAKCALGQQCYQTGVNTSVKPGKIIAVGSNHNPNDYCAPCNKIKYAISTKEAGLCACPENFFGDYYHALDGQQLLKSCTCHAPFSAVWQNTPIGLLWDCRCPDGKVLTPSYECRLFCGPYQQPKNTTISEAITKITISGTGLLPRKETEVVSKEKWHCETCKPGTNSDGVGPCIPCTGKKSFVANGTCQSCKAWQKVHLAMAHLGGSRCEDICLHGIYLPAALPNVHPEKETLALPPGKKKQPDPTANVAVQPVPVPPDGMPSPKGTVLLAKQVCRPCEGNAYALNNRCHGCGSKEIADIFARTCRPCDGKQVAKHIAGAWVCAADCSRVGGGRNVKPSTNHIADPDDRTKCIPCAKGRRPNADHTACGFSASISEKGPAPVGIVEPTLPPADAGPSKKDGVKDGPRRKTIRLVCPPGQMPNAAGTSCIRIRRTQPGGRATIKPPSGRISAPDKRRPSRWLFKQRIRPPTKTIPIPR